jgi:PAS domain S-box-containing protein
MEVRANILLVDDRPANLLALKAVLDELGQNVVEARSGAEALRRLQEDDFAVVLLDVQMAGLDGFETARQIRSRERSRHTPIIFITAYESDRFPVDQAYALGAVDYLVKPLVPIILRAKVAGFIDLFQKTEQIKRQAGVALRAAQEHLRIVTESMSAPVTRCSRDLRYLWVSKPYADWLGRPPEEIVGRPIREVIGPAAFESLRPYFERVLSGEQVRYEEEVNFRGLGPRWINAVYTPTFEPAALPDGWVAVVLDIDDRKRAEQALKEADRRKDQFLATLAHELRNPLAPLRNALHIMKTPGVSAETVRHARDVMERQVQYLARLVDDLLDVSRIMRNRIELRKERLDLATVFARAVETAQPAIDEQHHQLSVSLPDQPIILEGDLVRLAQVVGNLLVNAAKYTDTAGRIWLAGDRDGNDAVLRVRDTGIGISHDLLPCIFDLFTQAQWSLARSQGGLGIGLTVVKHLVEMHGGSVCAHSAGPGQGTEFVVRLPALK